MPLVVRGPGVAIGREVDTLTLLSDVAPTLTDLVGAQTPAFVGGHSPALWLGPDRPEGRAPAGPARLWPREGFPLDVRGESARPLPLPTYRALRSAQPLYVEYGYPDGRQETEFYNLERDPFELEKIARRADATRLGALSAKLGELQTCRTSGCRRVENGPMKTDAKVGY